ncbi:hypothetical protein MRX96_033521 [Rhipicephalus microplus]
MCAPRQCHRCLASASAALLGPTRSYEELRISEALQTNAATIVDFWQTRRAASSAATAEIMAASAVAVLPSPPASPTARSLGPLQQVTLPESSLVPPMCSLDPSHCPLPAATDDELMDSTNSRKRCRDDDESNWDAPRKHARPAPISLCTHASDSCDALPRPVQISAHGGEMPQPSTATSTPQLLQHPAAAFFKHNPQPMSVTMVKKKGESKRHGPHGTPAVHAGTATASQPRCTQEAPRCSSTVESSVPQSTVPAPENFTLMCSRGARRRARALAASPEILIHPAIAGTALFEWSASTGAFVPRSHLELVSALSSGCGVIKERVNNRRNIGAADVSSMECLEEILDVTELCSISVSTRIPADRGYSTGYLHGV